MPSDNLFREIGRVLVAYVKGQLLVIAIVTALYVVGFALVRVPLWFFVALVCGALNIIPRIGSLIALALVIVVALFGGGGMFHLLEVLAVWVVVQTLEGFVITPRLLGRPLGLRPLAVFIALLIGGALLGPIGLLVAVPALAAINVIWRHTKHRPV